MNTRTTVVCTVILFLVSFTRCDSFSLTEQFTKSSDVPLSLKLENTSILRGDTIGLYPSGGTKPYEFAVIAEDLYSGTATEQLGSVASLSFTAGSAIGKIVIQVTDADGKTARASVLVLPPKPIAFDMSRSVDNRTITLSWAYDETAIISNFLLKYTSDGITFTTSNPNPINSATAYDVTIPQSKTFTFYLYAVSGAYMSLPVQITSVPNL